MEMEQIRGAGARQSAMFNSQPSGGANLIII